MRLQDLFGRRHAWRFWSVGLKPRKSVAKFLVALFGKTFGTVACDTLVDRIRNTAAESREWWLLRGGPQPESDRNQYRQGRR